MAPRAHWKTPQSPGLLTLNELLGWTAADGSRPMLAAKRPAPGGQPGDRQWVTVTARAFYDRVRGVAAGLDAAGIACGDRVAILAESSPEWLVADFACLAIGAVDVPIYPTLTAGQIAYMLRDSGAAGIFISTREQALKLQPLLGELPGLRWLCCFAGPTELPLPLSEPRWDAWQSPSADAAAFAARLRDTDPGRTATLLYTSGTTGAPKGVALTHANLCANLNVSVIDFYFGEAERRLSILPLSHITERHVAYVDILFGATTFFAESMEQVAANLIEVHPTFLVSVPRLFEKVAAGVKAQAAAKSGLERAIFDWARRVGGRMAHYWLAGWRLPGATAEQAAHARLHGSLAAPPPWPLRLQAALADALVYRKLRARMGGKLHKIISGGAPLGRELAEFLLSLGMIIEEGYGLTETSPVVAINRPTGRRPGSIGRPLPNVEVRFAADGELLIRGPSVFSGYLHLPEATAEALRDGWFHSGDIGRADAEGFLHITDRKKDLIKTSGGKFIAPQPIEAGLKTSALVAEAVVVGDGRNYAAVLLVPHWPALEQHGFACPDQNARAAACAHPAVRALFQIEIDRLNATLARFETLKKFALLPGEFTVASGELTPTLKVRRRAVEQNHRALIAGLYDGS